MKKIKINFNKNSAQRLILIALKYRYLLFFMFFSAFLAFTFEFIYKYIYVDINFSDFEESYESRVALSIRTNDRMLKEILENIEQRNERLQRKKTDYNNPFEFINSDISEINEENSADTVENINKEPETGDNVENNLTLPLPDIYP